MKRRDFIAMLGGTIAAWPVSAHAQQGEHMRRIGVLMGYKETDPEVNAILSEFTQGLAGLGWTNGRNLRIDVRWAAGGSARAKAFARELLSMTPDVVLAVGGPAPVVALRDETHTLPIVFARVSDPVGQGLVASLARPGGNVTGFSNFEPEMAGKWLETLEAIAPHIIRVVVIGNPETSVLDVFFRSIVAASGSLTVETVRTPIQNVDDIKRAIAAAGDKPGGGLIVVPDAFNSSNRAAIIAQASQYRVPAIYPFRIYPSEGGLVSYGIESKEQLRGAASYVDRILNGEKPAELPVQMPTTFDLVINLKTAKALGLTVPPTLLAIADQVIE
jgi:putative ABC transport system substrate-binding protein